MMPRFSSSLLILLFLICSLLADASTLRSGLYENSPKIFSINGQTARGFFPELLDTIAEQNHWNVEYVPCEWSHCLAMLETGEIDLLPDVGYSQARAQRFDFNEEPVISSWSVVYRHPEATINTLLDLDGKRVVLLKESVQTAAIRKDAETYDIEPEFLYVDSFDEAFAMIRAGNADAAVVNRFYGALHSDEKVVETGIVLQPVLLKFAFHRGVDSELVKTIDRDLRMYKQDPRSAYYQLYETYLNSDANAPLPPWIKKLVGVMALGLFLLALVIYLYRNQLTKKSRELEESQESVRLKEKMLLLQSRQAMMGEMIGMIAHQWRQPLSAISLTVAGLNLKQELGEKLETDELNRAFEAIDQQVVHADETINLFRNFYHPEHQTTTVDLNEVVKQTLNLVGKTIEKHGIAIIFNRSDRPVELKIRDKELIQVLINLLTNARDALLECDQKDKRITLSLQTAGETASISVCDNGRGIPETIRSQIFDPYFSTKSHEKGTGLGLYMSKLIVDKHLEGMLELHQDEMTCFTISLPLEPALDE